MCPCGWKGRAVYDRSIRRWRHLDLGAAKLWLEGEIRRLHCRRCDRVRTEAVDWARPAARLSRDFEDVVAWLAQHTDKTTITSLLRTSWETVVGIVGRVVAEHLDTRRLDGLYRIGVDEVSYRKGHRYLTVVADHDRDGIVVWAGEGHDHTVLERFDDELGPDRCAALEAVSLDMGLAYQTATNHRAGQARQCVDPFHVIKAANTAIDKARRWAWNNERRRHPPPKRPRGRPPKGSPPTPTRPRWIKHTRWALLKDPEDLLPSQLDVLHQLRRERSVLYRSWQLKEGLRDLYRLRHPNDAAHHLDWWLAWACPAASPRSSPLAHCASQPRPHPLRCRTWPLELETRRPQQQDPAHQPPRLRTPLATAVIAMIYLCCGGITVELPTGR